MGPALGFALAQPPAAIVWVLTVLGVGMALPYVLLYWIPAVGRVLPRPGAWMETFKQALSFPMFAVAIWLVWIFGNQIEHASATLILLSAMLILSLGLWIYGRFGGVARGARTRWIARAVAIAIVAFALAAPIRMVAGSRAVEALPWQPFSEEVVTEIREQEGRMVFVNFTADWCVNCQLLEQTVLASRRVAALFEDYEVALLKADWTQYDREITDALAGFGRRSIPFFILYPADPDAAPMELGEWITRGQIERAVERAAAQPGPR
jgi:thiol:disulfide interchange protein